MRLVCSHWNEVIIEMEEILSTKIVQFTNQCYDQIRHHIITKLNYYEIFRNISMSCSREISTIEITLC
jgi:hypothetical protein